MTGLPAYAADLEVQVVDKNCFIEIFEDDTSMSMIHTCHAQVPKSMPR